MSAVVRRAVDDSASRFPRPGHQPERLRPIAWPRVVPSFRLGPRDSVYAIGSCFARNIEEHLMTLGFEVPSLDFCVRPGEFKGPRRNGILNKYTPASIRAELEAAAAFVGDGEVDLTPLVATADGRVVDVWLSSEFAVDRVRAVERRRQVSECFARAFDADVVVITLGQTETWFDCVTERYCNMFPPASIHRLHDGRFEFEQLDHDRCLDDLRAAIELLRRGPQRPRVLLSVSPVPMGRTFSGDDALVAYVRSKSILRTIAGTMADELDDVDYVPTFEAVILTDRSLAFDAELHVNDEVVATIVHRMVAAYTAPRASEAKPS